jgi:hypothetical protein
VKKRVRLHNQSKYLTVDKALMDINIKQQQQQQKQQQELLMQVVFSEVLSHVCIHTFGLEFFEQRKGFCDSFLT